LFTLGVGPAEEGGNELEDLELLRVAAVEGQEVEEVICYDLSRGGVLIRQEREGRGGGMGEVLPVNIVLWLALLEEAEGFCEVVV